MAHLGLVKTGGLWFISWRESHKGRRPVDFDNSGRKEMGGSSFSRVPLLVGLKGKPNGNQEG